MNSINQTRKNCKGVQESGKKRSMFNNKVCYFLDFKLKIGIQALTRAVGSLKVSIFCGRDSYVFMLIEWMKFQSFKLKLFLSSLICWHVTINAEISIFA